MENGCHLQVGTMPSVVAWKDSTTRDKLEEMIPKTKLIGSTGGLVIGKLGVDYFMKD